MKSCPLSLKIQLQHNISLLLFIRASRYLQLQKTFLWKTKSENIRRAGLQLRKLLTIYALNAVCQNSVSFHSLWLVSDFWEMLIIK